ncbi:hypothetical protein PGB34_09810 [Xenophilus arseniciresistens]|uniref:ABC-three component systems C-terminal domain-containing protein n=1 Tax=Xenophilus arseniciresistens TaxID=1283306 RepID=A0AAE3SZ29_9BURK|nr:ABC-three component system protein [Xenophilus arseniciresistens]MDA7416659.1 hypothetical protein [Xenophilus arseniciresistens]
MFPQTRQEGNVAGGHIAGRDVNITTHTAPHNYIDQLYESLKHEVNNSTPQEFIEQLQHFMASPPSQLSRSLADKLSDTNRQDIVETAELAKERAAKKIMRFQTSSAAQEIFAHILGELHTKYVQHVRPLIEAEATRLEIDAAFEEKVVAPVAQSMRPSTLGLSADVVHAFLFFLAGSCHVRWD